MKRLLVILFFLTFTLSMCGCSQTHVDKGDNVTLTFNYGEENINITLKNSEAERIISILDGNNYAPISAGVPSCGFDKKISLKVGNRVFAIARDMCSYIQDLGNSKFFSVPKEDMKYIHSLFEKYGGHFPCI